MDGGSKGSTRPSEGEAGRPAVQRTEVRGDARVERVSVFEQLGQVDPHDLVGSKAEAEESLPQRGREAEVVIHRPDQGGDLVDDGPKRLCPVTDGGERQVLFEDLDASGFSERDAAKLPLLHPCLLRPLRARESLD